MRLFILEDNDGRIERMQAELKKLNIELPYGIARTASQAIDILSKYLNEFDALSLDHDLTPIVPDEDPGDGLMVVHWLVAQPIKRFTLVHTSNPSRGIIMERTLLEHGWDCYWAVPHDGNEWIGRMWSVKLRELK